MRTIIRVAVFSFLVLMIAASAAYATGGGGPHLWLSTDPNQFNEGGIGYSNTAPGWGDDSYIAKNLPFTTYLYNAAPGNKGYAYDVGLIVAVHSGETNGSITIADAFGVEQTLTYSDFTTINPYPGGNHGIDGVYAVLKPSNPITLTTDWTGRADIASTSTSWTKFVVKSSSFSEVHFDAKSFNPCNVFYNPASHDVNWCGGGDPTVPEPATMSLLGLGLAGLFFRRKQKV